MALYNTISLPCQQVCNTNPFDPIYTTFDTTEVLTVGMSWWNGEQCYEIISLDGTPDIPLLALGFYDNCDECFTQNQLGADISICNNFKLSFFWLPEYQICEGGVYEFNGTCFNVKGIRQYNPEKDNPISFPEPPTFIGILNCEICLASGYTYIYRIIDCITNDPHTVGSNIEFVPIFGDVFSYVLESDPTTQRCGYFSGEIAEYPVEGFIIGFIGGQGSCDVCLEQSNKKVEVINCIDQSVEVVWASTFFNVDDITFIDFTVPGEGGDTQIRCCYTIGDETESEVTIPTILSYSVSPSCPECIECNGVYYLWEDCNNSEITGSSLSYQYMTIGETFVSPSNYGSCKKVIGASTNLPTDLLAGSLVDNEFTIQSNKFDDRVRYFFEQPNGKFLIGGHFNLFGSNTTNKIIRLNSDGTYDNTFVGGFTGGNVVIGIDQQSDGKILVVGDFSQFDNGITANTNNYICRLNTNGTFDTTFLPVLNNTGFDDITQGVEVQNDGKILVGGWFNNYNDGSGVVPANSLIRLNTDGSVDSTFNTGSGFINITEGDSRVFQTKTQLDGKIIVVGQFDEYDGLPAKGIIRLNSDGTRDTTFNMGTGFDGNPLDGDGYYLARWINLYSDGKMLISGHFEYYDGQPASKLIRLNSDGSIDTTFTSLGFGPALLDDRAIQTQIQSDGKIIVGGFFESYNSQSYEKLIRLNSDGTIDTSFYVGIGFDDYVLATYITSDYRLLVGGRFLFYKNFVQQYITELNLTPQIDTIYSSPIFTDCPSCVEQTSNLFAGNIFPSEMNGGIDDIALSIREQPDGKILIGGWYGDYNGDDVNSIFRINSDGTLDPTFQNYGLLNDAAYGIDLQSDGKILVGGWFDNYNQLPIVNGFARLNTDGTLDTTFLANTGFVINGQQYANNVIKVLPDDKILVGGGFFSYNDMDYRGVIKFNQNGSVDTTFNVSGTGVYNDYDPNSLEFLYTVFNPYTSQSMTCFAKNIDKRFILFGDKIVVSTSGNPFYFSETFVSSFFNAITYSNGANLLIGWYNNNIITIDPITYDFISSQIYSNTYFAQIGITNDSNYFYIYNNSTNNIDVINILTNTLITSLSSPAGSPSGFSFNPINNKIYFVCNNSNVYSIDTLTNTFDTPITTTGSNLLYLTVDTNNNKLYVQGASANLLVIDCSTDLQITTIPLPTFNYGNPNFDPNNNHIYVPNGDLIVIDTITDTIIDTQNAFGSSFVNNVIFDDNNQVLIINNYVYDPIIEKNYVGDYNFLGNRGVKNTTNNLYYICKEPAYLTSSDPIYPLYIFDPSNNNVVSTISLPEKGNFIIYESTLNTIWVTTDNYLLEIDCNTNTIVNTINGTYYDLIFDSGNIYTIDYTNEFLTKFNYPSYSITNLSVGTSPIFLSKDTDNNRIYVSNSGSDDVSVVDLNTFTVTNTISVGVNPRVIIYNPNDQTIYVNNDNDNTISYIDATTLIVGGTFPSNPSVYGNTIDTIINSNGYLVITQPGIGLFFDLNTKTYVNSTGYNGGNTGGLFIDGTNTVYIYFNSILKEYSFKSGRVYSFNVQSDGSILMGGYFKYYNETISRNIVKVFSDGQIDPTFNIGTGFSGGGNPLPGSVRNILTQSDGKFICTGHFTNYDGNSVNRIVRLNSDGSIDNTFNIGTGFDGRVLNSVLQSDGKIICIGEFEDYDGNSVNRIVRLNSDGSIDNTFSIGTGFDDTARTLCLLSDNTLLVSGYFEQYDNYPNSDYLVRLLTEPTVSNYSWYEFTPCNGGDVGYILMDSTFDLVGSIVRANYSDNSIICGTVGDFTLPESGYMYTLTDQTTYGTCFECNDGLVYGVTLRNCKTNELLSFNMSPNDIITILLFDLIFSIKGVDCYQLLDFCVIPNDASTISPYLTFNDCDSCLLPLSAGTESLLCVVDCSGNTRTISPAHPTWTNQFGKDVVLLDAIQLGGYNGYYA